MTLTIIFELEMPVSLQITLLQVQLQSSVPTKIGLGRIGVTRAFSGERQDRRKKNLCCATGKSPTSVNVPLMHCGR